MNDTEVQELIKKMNKEIISLYDSREYAIGKKFIQSKKLLKKFKLGTFCKKMFFSNKKKNNNKVDNLNNEILFKDNSLYQENNYNNEKIAVYTVNIGNYDNLLQPYYVSDKIDYYCVSDNKPNNLGVWKWIDANKYVGNLDLSNVKKARYIKTHPHLIFTDYKYSIFIDGNMQCVNDLSMLINKINKKTKIAIHPHPFRDCIYTEAICCKNSGKGNVKIIDKQIDHYRKEGMPSHFGLFETNIVVREHNDNTCKKIDEAWWNELNNYSERDQLSFTYVLWKNGFVANDIGVIAKSIKDNEFVHIVNHISESSKNN